MLIGLSLNGFKKRENLGENKEKWWPQQDLNL